MRKSTISPWLVAVLYVGFIYATLSVVPAPLLFLRSHNVLRLTLSVVYISCFIVLVAQLSRGKKQWWRFITLAGIFALYPAIALKTSSPEEQIHFFEYGLVGVLFARALAGNKPYTWKTWLGALALGIFAGWIDELLQGLLPNRHYDVRDIFLNAVSVTLGLGLRALYPTSPPSE